MRLPLAATIALLTLAPGAHADEPLVAPPRPEHVAEGPLEALDYFLGDWEIDATWAWGATLRARNQYRVGLGGNFVEVATIVSDNAGPVYERYFSVYAHDKAANQTNAIGFTADGSVTTLPTSIRREGDAIVIDTDLTQDGTRVRQQVRTDGPDAYRWNVWMTAPGSDAEQLVMDGVWRRVTGAPLGDQPDPDDPWASSNAAPTDGPHPIDPTLFAARGADLRSFSKTVEIDAPPADVFDAWATPEGWKAVYDMPQSKANIDLAVGGRYEWLFNGVLGSNGCQILSYIPDRMLSFTWNAPPTQPESRRMRTWVVVELEPTDDASTELTLTHLGFGDAEHWDETEQYFQNAWSSVLAMMREHFAPGD